MLDLTWPGPVIDKKNSPTYEWAYMKAYLEGEANERAAKVFEAMFGDKPGKGVPYWLVRMAIYYGALVLGHTRANKVLAGIDKQMFYCVSKLDEKLLRNTPNLMKHMWLHDVELAEIGGRELTD